jgi:TPR repeat protein
LRPLAEDSTKPDPAAQFLLAILYDTGQGVPRNVPRACGLYRQVARMDGPFTGTAETLGRMLHEDSPVPEQMCSTGPWHDQPEASFTLGPGHTVQYSSNTIVLRYKDAEQRIVTGNLPGVVPLPANMPGPKPPSALDLTSLARVHLGASGDVEWVTTGPNGRSAIVARREPR